MFWNWRINKCPPRGPGEAYLENRAPLNSISLCGEEEAEPWRYFLSRVRGDQGGREQQQRGEFLREFKKGRELCV